MDWCVLSESLLFCKCQECENCNEHGRGSAVDFYRGLFVEVYLQNEQCLCGSGVNDNKVVQQACMC
eukprot:scaffold73837_cov19-Tisochrysis_lutea.AAC.1